MNSPLLALLEKADLEGFWAQCQDQGVHPLEVRMDGINMFSGIIVCNTDAETKIKLLQKALAKYPDTQVMQKLIDEKMSVTDDPRQPAQLVQAIPFMVSHQRLSECEVLLEGVTRLGVYIPDDVKHDMQSVLLEHFGCSKLRIERFFEEL